MPPRPLLSLLVAAPFLAACGIDGRAEAKVVPNEAGRDAASPFALFQRDDMRAGIDFAVLDAAAVKEQRYAFMCRPLWAGARRCELKTTGIPGRTVAEVDSAGRVVRIAFLGEGSTLGRESYNAGMFRKLSNDMRASFDSVRPGLPDAAPTTGRGLRWVTTDGRWSASMWYPPLDERRFQEWPDRIVVTDEAAWRSLREADPAVAAAGRTVTLAEPPGPGVGTQMVAAPAPTPAAPVATTAVALDRSVADGTPAAAPPSVDVGRTYAAMERALRDLVSEEEVYFTSNGRYTLDLKALGLRGGGGVTLAVASADRWGFAAVARHPGLPGRSCVLWLGRVRTPPRTAREGRSAPEGEPTCDLS